MLCQYVDKWYKSSDKPSFQMARRLIHEEGLLCGMWQLLCSSRIFCQVYCSLLLSKGFSLILLKMLHRARLWDCMLSICPSVTIRYRDHIGWNSSKIISQPNSLRPLLNNIIESIDSCCLQCIKIDKFNYHNDHGATVCHKNFGSDGGW